MKRVFTFRVDKKLLSVIIEPCQEDRSKNLTGRYEIKMELLIGILIVAAFMDMRHYKIPNWCIAPGMAAGLFLSWQQGAEVLLVVLVQTALIFAVFYPFYLMGGIGAGDVKLFMLLGCYLEQHKLMVCIGIAMMLAGAAALVRIICSKECRQHAKEVLRYVYKMLRTGAMTDDMPLKSRAAVIRLAVPVLCSTLLCMGGVL